MNEKHEYVGNCPHCGAPKGRHCQWHGPMIAPCNRDAASYAQQRNTPPPPPENVVSKQKSLPDAGFLPWSALWPVIRVFQLGGRKYGRLDWRFKGQDRHIYLNKIYRHWEALQRGEVFDSDSGERHEAAIAANALILLDLLDVVNKRAGEAPAAPLSPRDLCFDSLWEGLEEPEQR